MATARHRTSRRRSSDPADRTGSKSQSRDSGRTDRRIGQLLVLLMDHPMVGVSGARIASEVGVSRSAVWSWVERLRALGVKVKGHPSSGYRLEQAPDILVPHLLEARLRGTPFAARIHHYFRAGSTNEIAMELAAQGEPHGTLVVAEEQTRGRGRLGRHWHSARTSGLYASFLLRPPLSPAEAPLLTLAAGVAARRAVAEVSGLDADLRWPNDAMLRDAEGRWKKFCGILTEMQAEARRIRHVVVGVGLNVNQEKFPSDLTRTATSLRRETGREYSRIELLVRLLTEFTSEYNRLLREGGRPLVGAFTRASSYARGKRVKVSDPREEFAGVTAGLDPTGCLLVKRADTGRTVPVIAGDVRELD